MVKRGTGSPSISQEFAGGILPGLTGGQQPPASEQVGQQAIKPVKHQDSPTRKKVTLYLDEPNHTDLMDDLLSALKKFGLPRDNSMLVRALLNQARAVLSDQARLEALAHECQQTLPNR